MASASSSSSAPRHDAILRRTQVTILPRVRLPDRISSGSSRLDFTCRLCEVDGDLDARALYQCFTCDSYLCAVHVHDFRAMRGTSWRGFRWGYCAQSASPSGRGPLRCCRPTRRSLTDPVVQQDTIARARERSRGPRLVGRVPETDVDTLTAHSSSPEWSLVDGVWRSALAPLVPLVPLGGAVPAPAATAAELQHLADVSGVSIWVASREEGLVPGHHSRPASLQPDAADVHFW